MLTILYSHFYENAFELTVISTELNNMEHAALELFAKNNSGSVSFIKDELLYSDVTAYRLNFPKNPSLANSDCDQLISALYSLIDEINNSSLLTPSTPELAQSSMSSSSSMSYSASSSSSSSASNSNVQASTVRIEETKNTIGPLAKKKSSLADSVNTSNKKPSRAPKKNIKPSSKRLRGVPKSSEDIIAKSMEQYAYRERLRRKEINALFEKIRSLVVSKSGVSKKNLYKKETLEAALQIIKDYKEKIAELKANIDKMNSEIDDLTAKRKALEHTENPFIITQLEKQLEQKDLIIDTLKTELAIQSQLGDIASASLPSSDVRGPGGHPSSFFESPTSKKDYVASASDSNLLQNNRSRL